MTKDDQHLQQCLSVFFPAYAFSSSSHAAVIEAAFLPTLRKVCAVAVLFPLLYTSGFHTMLVADEYFLTHHHSAVSGAACTFKLTAPRRQR